MTNSPFKPSNWKSTAAIALLSLSGVSATLDPIVIKGSKFFYKTNGTQFFVKGVAYQQGQAASASAAKRADSADYSDPLADTDRCKDDIPRLAALGVNAIRTYSINPTADHTVCMKLLDDNGIYVISDLSEPSQSINRESPIWDTTLMKRYTDVIDELQQYSNVIGFFAGNEVVNSLNVTNSAVVVKAAVRDTKAYIASKGYRPMGVGYAADDDANVRAYISSYLNCGEAADSIDFWGYNIYEWCGADATYETSGYSQRVAEFKDYNVPTFFAEYGCNKPNGGADRPFTEVEALYGSKMTDTFSGGIVFEYFQGDNDYGLVSIDGSSVSTFSAYSALSTQLGKVSPSAISADSYTPTLSAAACPTVDDKWKAASSPLPPTPDSAVCDCMVSSLKCTLNKDTSDAIVGDLLGQVCGYNGGKACEGGIQLDYTTGSYGAFAMCSAAQRLAFAMDSYYNEQGNSDACDFGGNATIVDAKPASGTCSSIIASASAAASSAGGGSGGSGGSGAASSSTSKSEATGIVGASLGMGKWAGIYVLAAVFSGAGMIWL